MYCTRGAYGGLTGVSAGYGPLVLVKIIRGGRLCFVRKINFLCCVLLLILDSLLWLDLFISYVSRKNYYVKYFISTYVNRPHQHRCFVYVNKHCKDSDAAKIIK